MSESTEIEYKTLLTEEEYLRLLQKYSSFLGEAFSQTNVYFDTPDYDLKKRGMGLRIRLYESSSEITLKSPLNIGLLETTDHLSLEEGQALIAAGHIKENGNVWKKLEYFEFSVFNVKIVSELATTRREGKINQDTLLVLDKSNYYGKTDFELEMEVANDAEGKVFFNDFLIQNELSYIPAKNKITRAFEEKNK